MGTIELDSAPPTTEPETPVPRRYWWLKRIVAMVLVAVIAGVILNWWWVREADRRYRALIADAHSRGEPILPADFEAGQVPPSENAAAMLTNAGTTLRISQAMNDFEEPDVGTPLTTAQIALLRATVAANAKSLRLVRLARPMQGVDWNIKLVSPVFLYRFGHLTPQRELARCLSWSADYHHAVGDDHEAIEELLDIVRQGHVLSRGPATLVVHLVSIGITAIACDSIDRIAADLQIEDGTMTPPSAPAATRAQVLALIAELTDDEEFRRDRIRGWQGERMGQLDAFRSMFAGYASLFPTPMPPGTRGLIGLDAIRAADDVNAALAASEKPSWQTAVATLPANNPNASQLEELSKIFNRILTGALGRAVQQDFRLTVQRRVAATQLAIRLYRVDHGGMYPATLDELTPAYLAKLPADPFAADGRPMGYHLAPWPALYSVGLNGIDEGGKSLPPAGGGPPSKWECADIVFPLEAAAPAAPATQPSAKTQNNQ